MDEPVKKRVDEAWKEQAEREKSAAVVGPPAGGGPKAAPVPPDAAPEEAGTTEPRFDLFISGLAMETLIALGDMPHPATRKQALNLTHAKYLVDLLGILEEKTKGNLSVDEERLLKDTLYQLRMRYLTKSGGS